MFIFPARVTHNTFSFLFFFYNEHPIKTLSCSRTTLKGRAARSVASPGKTCLDETVSRRSQKRRTDQGNPAEQFPREFKWAALGRPGPFTTLIRVETLSSLAMFFSSPGPKFLACTSVYSILKNVNTFPRSCYSRRPCLSRTLRQKRNRHQSAVRHLESIITASSLRSRWWNCPTCSGNWSFFFFLDYFLN